MKAILATAITALLLASSAAVAEKPASPGGFGKDRAAWIHAAQNSDEAPGASEWGIIASQHAGDNGTINNDYKCLHGNVPPTVPFCLVD